jgi:hypothetical protein
VKFGCSYLLILGLLILGCEGKQGPMGPQGPPGSGTRIIYNGTASSDEFVVNIPELHLDDFPSINCYYFFDGSWSELYVGYDKNDELMLPYALIEEQKIILFYLNGLQYKIVLVI